MDGNIDGQSDYIGYRGNIAEGIYDESRYSILKIALNFGNLKMADFISVLLECGRHLI